jgi:putative endonuclease
MSIENATTRMKLGLKAEEAVCNYLMAQGYRILDRNWRRPWGELDVVAEHRGIIHIVEVKASSANISGFEPFLRADGRKMHKVKRTAQTWLSSHKYGPDTEWQLDIASVIMSKNKPEIELFENI